MIAESADEHPARWASLPDLKQPFALFFPESPKLPGVEALGQWATQLRALNIHQALYAEEVRALARLSQLQRLAVDIDSRLTDDDLRDFANLTELRWLEFHYNISEPILRAVARLPRLETLILNTCWEISEGMTKEIASCPQLCALEFGDAAKLHVAHLKGITGMKLTRLAVPTETTDAEIKGLQQTMPSCDVSRRQG